MPSTGRAPYGESSRCAARGRPGARSQPLPAGNCAAIGDRLDRYAAELLAFITRVLSPVLVAEVREKISLHPRFRSSIIRNRRLIDCLQMMLKRQGKSGVSLDDFPALVRGFPTAAQNAACFQTRQACCFVSHIATRSVRRK